MDIITDLHLHSRFARGCSKDLTLSNMEKWARVKGIDVLGTGDFQHPQWFQEIKKELTEKDGLLYSKDGYPFLLTTEISLIYTQGGKGRKIHNIVWAPSLEVAERFQSWLKSKGRIDYDGRPIFKIPCPEFVESVRKIDDRLEVIPAHCLLGSTPIHTNRSIKRMKDMKKGDTVFTHDNNWKKITEIYVRPYSGKTYKIQPWCWTEGLETTPEHPFFAIKSFKCSWIKGLCKKSCSKLGECKHKRFEKYLREWVPASKLKQGDFLVYPRFNTLKDKTRIGKIKLDKNLCRLVGYYLAEGYTIREEGIGFSFNRSEDHYIKEIIELVKKIFGKDKHILDERKGKDIIFYSRSLYSFFKQFYNEDIRKAHTKCLPAYMTEIPVAKQVELFRGWYRGDKGYTVSRELMNQMKIICLRLGIIPNIYVDSAKDHEKRGKHFIKGRKILANHDLYCFGNLSFFEDNFHLLQEREFKKFNTKLRRRHGWIDKEYVYLPIRKISTRTYSGKVYNVEVEEDNSYVAEFSCIHNCWTPWFSLFGANSGFDSLQECFQDQSKHIHAIETGMSSDPAMNWRIPELQKKSIVSFSDSHSFWPWRLGRESTILTVRGKTYDDIVRALRSNRVKQTVETDPNYGKYHFTGHRNCHVVMSPKEANKQGNICPVCKRTMTVGVLERVEALAKHPEGYRIEEAKPFVKLVPLSELIAGYLKTGVTTRKVWETHSALLKTFKNEFTVLLEAPLDALSAVVEQGLAQVILANREGNLMIKPGFDGLYGVPQIHGDEDYAWPSAVKHVPWEEPPKKPSGQTGLDRFA